MTRPKISIIIPVYNVEKYLAECLNSCINQTLEDIEIICVDDCSTDNSYKILEEYQQKDSRIKIFLQPENKKQGAARNKGLEVATGEYIWFVDSDDYIDTKACQILYDTIKEFDVDILCFSAIQFQDSNSRYFFYNKYCHQGLQINKIYHPKTKWLEIFFSNLNVAPWAYLTKRNAIQNLRFREGVWHEDNDFTPILLTSVNSFCFIPYSAYFYRINPNSTTQTTLSQKRADDLISMLESLDEFIRKKDLSQEHFVYVFLVGMINNIYSTFLNNPETKLNNFNKLLDLKKRYYKKYSLQRFGKKIWKRLFETNA